MMKRLAWIIVISLLAACQNTQSANLEAEPIGTDSQVIFTYHDDERDVTCWVYSERYRAAGGISCIPDHELTEAAR